MYAFSVSMKTLIGVHHVCLISGSRFAIGLKGHNSKARGNALGNCMKLCMAG